MSREADIWDEEGYVVDARAWPLVLMIVPERTSLEGMEGALGRLEALYGRREKHLQITDTRRLREMPSARERVYAGEWTDRTADLQARYSLGGALVIESVVARGVLTAVHWIRKPPAPTAIVRTMDEALAWAEERFREAGLSMPARFPAVS